jgi:PEP-CTERM motif
MSPQSSVWRLTQALALLAFAGVAQAGTVLDQINPFTANFGFNDMIELQQQVTDGIAGQLTGVELFTRSGADTVTVSIGVGSAFFTGPYAFTTTATIGSTGTVINTSSGNITLTVGEHFVIDVSGGPGCCNLAGSTSNYSGGDLFSNNSGAIADLSLKEFPQSMAFETLITQTGTSGVPEPGTLVLFGSGITGLIWIQRRRA